MKRGQKVWVCYDGKLCRASPGVILKTHRGWRVLVEFIPYGGEELMQVWFRMRRVWRYHKAYEAFVRHEYTFMDKLFGLPGDYHSLVKWKCVHIPKAIRAREE